MHALLNIINKQPDIDKIYLHAKDPCEAKYQFLINKRESICLKHFDDPKAFIKYSNDVQNIYKNTDEYNIDRKRTILIVFDNMIADVNNNKKLNSIVTVNILLVFTAQSYFKVPQDVKLNTTHSFIMKIPNKRELKHFCNKSFIRY